MNEGQRTQLRGIIRIIGRVQSLRTSIQERANLHQMAEASLRAIERQQWAAYSNLPDQFRDVGPDLEIIVAISYIETVLSYLEASKYQDARAEITKAIAVVPRVA